jgi:succinylglutamate desuccinylase
MLAKRVKLDWKYAKDLNPCVCLHQPKAKKNNTGFLNNDMNRNGSLGGQHAHIATTKEHGYEKLFF